MEIFQPPTDEKKEWTKAVLVACRSQCVNCGSTDRLKVLMLVPEEAGGKLVDSNGTVLCRACEMARDAAERALDGSKRRLINFWVSRHLHERIDTAIKTRNGFVSMGHLVRYMMSKYVTDPERFDDLERYQDFRKSEVKVNVWVDSDQYGVFKRMVQDAKMTVTDAVKSLIQVYDEETTILDRAGKPHEAQE